MTNTHAHSHEHRHVHEEQHQHTHEQQPQHPSEHTEDCIAHKHEHNACCCHSHAHEEPHAHHHHHHGEGGKLQRVEIIAAAVLLAGGLLCPATLGSLKLILYIAAWLVAGLRVLIEMLHSIGEGNLFDETFLMSIASIGALVVGETPEAAAVMLFFRVGEFAEEMAESRSRRNIAQLMDIRPDQARVLRNGEWQSVEPRQVNIGETIQILPGERVPLDCRLLTGLSTLDTAALTGESVPQDVQPGDQLLSGSVNISSPLTAQVEQEYELSTVNRILLLVEEATAAKSKSERFITRFARWYTPAVCLAALLLAVIPPLFGLAPWHNALHRACVLLVASCPCALVISVPLTFFGGIGGASRRGILIKGGAELEQLAKVNTAAFDKTGTLTQGNFEITSIYAVDGNTEGLLQLAALAESCSPHPLAAAVLKACKSTPDSSLLQQIQELPGRGVSAIYGEKTLLAGNLRLMQEQKITVPQEQEQAAIHIALGGQYQGSIHVGDQLKEGTEQAIRDLRKLGVERCLILSGDRSAAVEQTAAAIQIPTADIRAGLLPADKLAEAERLMENSGTVLLYAGDGVNDAPLLARADVGVAMGGLGSDAAIEAADIVIMNDDPRQIALGIRLARRCMRIARQNIALTLIIKAAILILGACGIASMWAAVFADVGVSLLAILNASRTLR